MRSAGLFCPAHRHAARPDEDRPSPSRRGYGRTWQRLRQMVLARDQYLCQVCGRVCDEGADVDHITPRSAGGRDELANLQTLCHACHARKTATEDGGFGR